jgi:hypothetical protein
MARTAVVRSASLTPEEARFADELAAELAGGSFTELTRRMLRGYGRPLKQRIDELRAAGLDPHEHLAITRNAPEDAEAQVRAFYARPKLPDDALQRPPQPA